MKRFGHWLTLLLLLCTPQWLWAKSYKDGFVEYWQTQLQRTDSIVIFILLFGALCVGIIMFSTKRKA